MCRRSLSLLGAQRWSTKFIKSSTSTLGQAIGFEHFTQSSKMPLLPLVFFVPFLCSFLAIRRSVFTVVKQPFGVDPSSRY